MNQSKKQTLLSLFLTVLIPPAYMFFRELNLFDFVFQGEIIEEIQLPLDRLVFDSSRKLQSTVIEQFILEYTR